MRSVEIQCPICKSPFAATDNGQNLRCAGRDGHVFPVVSGVPILINDENSVFAISDYVSPTGHPDTIVDGLYNSESERKNLSALRKIYRKLAVGLTEFKVKTSRNTAADAIAIVTKETSDPLILVLGSAEYRFRYSDNASFIYTDIAISDGVKYVCDAHDLPFADESFDLVIAESIFEHVADPYRVAAEIHRVLRTEKYIYACTPFMQPVHLGVYDFTRFTYTGYRRLFRRFDEILLEPVLGPGSSFAYGIQHLLTSFSPKGNVKSILNLIGLLISRPFKYLDKILLKQKSALPYSAGFGFIGRKSERTLSDRELVEIFSKRI